MALQNEILVGRFNKALNSIFGMKSGPPAPQLAGEITAQISLDQSGSVDRRFPEGWNRWAAVIDAPAGGVGNIGQCLLQNPNNSNVITVVEKIKFGTVPTAGAGTTFLGMGNNAGTTVVASVAIPLDQRIVKPVQGFAGQPLTRAGYVNTVASPVSPSFPIDLYNLPAGSFVFDILFTSDQQIVLLPGDFLNINGIANTELNATYFWRERVFEASELRG